jgi:hypothetical protein
MSTYISRKYFGNEFNQKHNDFIACITIIIKKKLIDVCFIFYDDNPIEFAIVDIKINSYPINTIIKSIYKKLYEDYLQSIDIYEDVKDIVIDSDLFEKTTGEIYEKDLILCFEYKNFIGLGL